ncbi:MAG: sigma-70 family RNA polymerase sigma factor [Clostridia bacterium]|nr:sigma-70 family RNA polymerase sigma factor [Clostridia bacterium]
MDSDRIFVERVLSGNIESFTELVNKYYPKIVSFIYKMSVSRHDSEDIAQDVFIKVYNNLYKYDQRWSFSTWVFKIAANTYKDFKKKKRVKTEELQDYAISRENSSPEEYIENTGRQELIEKMFNSLKDDVKAIMILYHFHQLSFKEIGRIHGISSEAVKMKIFRARNKLSKEYSKSIIRVTA